MVDLGMAFVDNWLVGKVKGSGSPSGTSNDGERDDHNNSRHITSVLL